MPDASPLATAAPAAWAGVSARALVDSATATSDSAATRNGLDVAARASDAPGLTDGLVGDIAVVCGSASGGDGDEQVLLRFAAGDLAAFDTLYARHENSVWRFVRRQIRDPAIAEELLQDVWFAVVRHAARYEPRARFKTWLFTIAQHRMVDHFRTHRVHASLGGGAHAHGDPPDSGDGRGVLLADTLAADSAFGPLREASRREAGAALLRAVEALPAPQRDAFLLQAEGELSVEEIAVATGTPFETAKSRLRYARSALRLALKEFA